MERSSSATDVGYAPMATDAEQLLTSSGHESGRVASAMFPGRREDESALQAAPRALILGGFICIYAGVCISVLNDSAHLPRFWLTNPHTMSFFSTALLTVGGIALVGLVLLLALRPEVRPACTCTDVCKANRIGGYVYQCSVLALLVSLPYLAFFFYSVREFRPQEAAWFVAGVFALLTVQYSFREITKHLQNYRLPLLQKNIVRILLMPPVVSTAALFPVHGCVPAPGLV